MDRNVGAAAAEAGVSAKAVRLWESKGLLPPAQRTEAGYRRFDDDDISVLRFIRQAKTLGLTLAEIKEVLELQRGGVAPCDRVTALLDERIADIDRTLGELRTLRRALTGARHTARESRRRGEDAVVCHIIEAAPNDTDSEPERDPSANPTSNTGLELKGASPSRSTTRVRVPDPAERAIVGAVNFAHSSRPRDEARSIWAGARRPSHLARVSTPTTEPAAPPPPTTAPKPPARQPRRRGTRGWLSRAQGQAGGHVEPDLAVGQHVGPEQRG